MPLIKLTDRNSPLPTYIEANSITRIQHIPAHDLGDLRITEATVVYVFGSATPSYVKETPDEVYALMNS